MTRTSGIFTLAAAFSLISSPVFAEGHNMKKAEESDGTAYESQMTEAIEKEFSFSEPDTNDDGSVTADEFASVTDMEDMDSTFSMIDKNADGMLSPAELEAYNKMAEDHKMDSEKEKGGGWFK
jgi:hypothetical protein